ncbi:MAG: SEC-C metal-binding domain-containing protein [Chlamydia suis]|uniref:YecA family protein n=1 Tax=Chlamydia suis TaxID=83559 RepID=UPI0003BFF2D5|nr:SEC-C metal-binding domain-containing protein [Chlamydia suis]ESN89681.1 pretranslocase subunit-like protein [Chlamydia suis MD56]MDD6309619.1 SEC-C metal-binding domain-containing protein [Chlamydia suis]
MLKKPNRNDPCPCGSGKKYKQCCLKSQTQTVRHTPDGKFKFSVTTLPTTSYSTESFTKLFQQSVDSVIPEQKEVKNKFLITKNKELVGKRAIRKAKAKEERIISEKLSQHEFQVMDTTTSDDTTPSSQNQESVFLPTQEDYRVHKKEENQESELS